MASLFRHSRSVVARILSMHRTATTTATAGTQVKTSNAPASISQTSRSTQGPNMVARDAWRRTSPADAIKPRPAGEPSYIPLVGRALNTWGQIGFGIVLAISAYFMYINYVINPEFYKSLKLSREAGSRGSHEQPADREGTIGQKIDAAGAPKGELNKHL